MNPPMLSSFPPPNFKPPAFMNPSAVPRVEMPPPIIAPLLGSDVMPKESLYINNLNDKMKPEGKFSLIILSKNLPKP